jgi:hypothetical protein
VSTSTWGWDPKQHLGDKYGFGTSWNKTTNKLERICKGYNEAILFIDETNLSERKKEDKKVDVLEAIMRIDGQMEKDRLTDQGPSNSWNMPVLSTSNVSVPKMVRERRFDTPEVFCDRLIDIPAPREGFGMFEDLYGFEDGGKLSEHLKNIASANHGLAARAFIGRVMRKRAENSRSLTDFLRASAAEYKKTAKGRLASSPRDLTRIHDKFSTVYAADAWRSKRVFCLTKPRTCWRQYLPASEIMSISFMRNLADLSSDILPSMHLSPTLRRTGEGSWISTRPRYLSATNTKHAAAISVNIKATRSIYSPSRSS